jgi:uncharacterized iron-regulated membrane protein
MNTFRTILFTAAATSTLVFSGTTMLFSHSLTKWRAAPAAIIGFAERTGPAVSLVDQVVVTHDGTVVELPQLSMDQGKAIAKALGEGHSAIVGVTCDGPST